MGCGADDEDATSWKWRAKWQDGLRVLLQFIRDCGWNQDWHHDDVVDGVARGIADDQLRTTHGNKRHL